MSTPKVKQIPSLHPIADPAVKAVLEAMREQLDAIQNSDSASLKRPTIQDLIDAGVPNADKL